MQILTISTVKATGIGDWVLKKMLAPNDGRVIWKVKVGITRKTQQEDAST
jgi:hypothetical protein